MEWAICLRSVMPKHTHAQASSMAYMRHRHDCLFTTFFIICYPVMSKCGTAPWSALTLPMKHRFAGVAVALAS